MCGGRVDFNSLFGTVSQTPFDIYSNEMSYVCNPGIKDVPYCFGGKAQDEKLPLS